MFGDRKESYADQKEHAIERVRGSFRFMKIEEVCCKALLKFS